MEECNKKLKKKLQNDKLSLIKSAVWHLLIAKKQLYA